ncbi:hypothetical protein [Lapillicoccus sp.]|uniref:hypothetical protein n=1 Tax=Lapillicoccus sp. TaxID=1909287 RepID=UPI0025E8FD21|nr:hypothetical protein [Lapillicoccus sp.]
MSYPELDLEFRSLTAQPLDSEAVRAEVVRGIAARARLRRTAALVSSALAVVVLIGGIGLVAQTDRAAPDPAASTWPAEPAAVIPPGSHMVPFTGAVNISSPVTPTVDAPTAADTMVWSRDVNTLQVAWTAPRAAGVSTAARPTGSVLNAVELMQRGYVISPSAGLTVGATAVGSEPDRLAPLVAPRQIVLAGHPATLGSDPGSVWPTSIGISPVKRWLQWQLPDGRYIHVWAGTGGDPALLAFGAGLIDRPTTLTRKTTVGVSLPGYTVQGIVEMGTATELDAAQSLLCPTGTVTTLATVTPPCLQVSVVPTRTLGLDPTAKYVAVTVDGRTTRLNLSTQEASADLGRGFSVSLFSALTTDVSALDLATLAAAVRLDPSVVLGHSRLIDPPPGRSTVQSSTGSASSAANPSGPGH